MNVQNESSDQNDTIPKKDYNFIPTSESLSEICQIIQQNCYESILIPSHIVEIDSYTFQWCKSLKHIVLAEGVKRIGDFAFFECLNLRTVFLSSTVESIGKSAFLKCDRIKSISVHQNNPYFILKDNILFTKDMTKLVLFPRIVELKNYSIPSNVITICESSFHSSSLQHLYISANVSEIGESAFRNTSCQFEVDENNPNFTVKDGILFSKDMKTLISSHAIARDDYYVSATVEKICDSAFYRSCYRKIFLPKNLKHIGNYAFESMENMQSIRIPQTVTHIGYCAFKDTPNLKMIDVDTNNQFYASIYGQLYSKDLKTLIAVPAAINIFELLDEQYSIDLTVFHFCDFAFSNFKTPFEVDIPDGVESIGNNCFENSYILSISIPASVTNIGHLAFACCTFLAVITVDKDNPNFASEDGVLFSKDMTTLLFYPRNKPNESYIIPPSVTHISPWAFYECGCLHMLTISPNVKYLPYECVQSLPGLTNLVLQEGLRAIGINCFSHTGIVHLVIPSTVNSIGHCAFLECHELEYVEISASVSFIAKTAFIGCPKLRCIYVNPNNLKYASFDKALFTKDMKTLLRFPPNSKITSYSIPKTVELFGMAFHSCSSLISIEIPQGTTKISKSAFDGCFHLSSVNISASVAKISRLAFHNTRNLNNINVDENNPFYSSIDGVLFTKNLDRIIVYPSGKPNQLYSIPRQVRTISENAFVSTSLVSINIPYGVKEICENAFYFCHRLRSVSISSTVESISNNSFNFRNLQSVSIASQSIPLSLFKNYFANLTNSVELTICSDSS